MVERMEERLEAAQSDQKNLFLIVFQVNIYVFCRCSLGRNFVFHVTAFHHDIVGACCSLRYRWQGFQYVLVPMDCWAATASFYGGKHLLYFILGI